LKKTCPSEKDNNALANSSFPEFWPRSYQLRQPNPAAKENPLVQAPPQARRPNALPDARLLTSTWVKTSFLILARAMCCRMLLTFGFGLFLIVGAQAQAQRFPTYDFKVPAQPPFPSQPFPNFPTPKGPALPMPGKGSYQTLDGVWHKARINFLTYGIRVDDLSVTADPEVAAPLVPLEQVLCIVVRHDTLAFRLLENRGGKTDAKPAYYYLKQVFRGGGWTLYPGLLKNEKGSFITIPARKADFQQLMLEHFGGCLPLREKIEQGIFDPSTVEGIVRQYARWKTLPAGTTLN
jgi:hypothetical protein